MTTTYYKVLNTDGTCYHGGAGRWELGVRRSVMGRLVACEHAIHACTLEQLPTWLGPAIWEIALEDAEDAGDKTIARAGTLTRRIETWTDQTARLFAADCAAHVLHLTKDARCLEAVFAARRYAFGLIDAAARDAARGAAWAAAGAAAGGAARGAAWAAAGAAAWAAAGAAARGAAWAAARNAERAWQAARLGAYLRGEVDLASYRNVVVRDMAAATEKKP